MVTEEMVNRFLSWPLPKSVCSDTCVTNNAYPYPRSGTNLLTADETKQMLEYVLASRSSAPAEEAQDEMATGYLYHCPTCKREIRWITEADQIDFRALVHRPCGTKLAIEPRKYLVSRESAPEELVSQLKELAGAATEGPWAWDQGGEKVNEWGLGIAVRADETPIVGHFTEEDVDYVEHVCSHEAATCNYKDPELICLLRNNLDTIIEALSRPAADREDAILVPKIVSDRMRDAATAWWKRGRPMYVQELWNDMLAALSSEPREGK